MKLQEINERLSAISTEIDTILDGKMTPETKASISTLEKEEKELQEELALRANQAKRAKAVPVANIASTTPELDNFTRSFGSYLETGIAPVDFRGSKSNSFVIPQETLRSLMEKRATDTTAIGDAFAKTVQPGVSIAKAPALSMLQELGSKFVFRPIGSGVYTMPSTPIPVAGFAAEGAGSVDASISLHNKTLTPVGNRITVKSYFTLEEQAMLDPTAQSDLIQGLADAIWQQAAYKYFDNLEADASLSKVALAGVNLDYTDFTNLEAAVPYELASPRFVAAPKVAAKAKRTAMVANTISGPIWTKSILEGEVDGLPAKGTIFANTGSLYYGDFGQMTVCQWGGLEIQVNPFEKDSEGEVKVVARAIIDSGVQNYRFFAFTADPSLA